MNTIRIGGHNAVVVYDDEIGMFRGEFIGLNGGADFYADAVPDLKKQGELSLKLFLDTCKQKGINPQRPYSGKFQVRIAPSLHARAAVAAAERKISLNSYVMDAMESKLQRNSDCSDYSVYQQENFSERRLMPRKVTLGIASGMHAPLVGEREGSYVVYRNIGAEPDLDEPISHEFDTEEEAQKWADELYENLRKGDKTAKAIFYSHGETDPEESWGDGGQS